ncbi:SIMPL domain-containing protein, partial [Acinetobacter nosocomialis]|uniref:SIMPL domain-containing protein n=1 Tax=Acinetobacter nosocomialis TaxID=106654 RepID=UPI0030F4BFB7
VGFRLLLVIPALALTACGDGPRDPRGVDRNETLLSVAATGKSEARPDEARFTVGVNTIAASAAEATRRNNETMAKVSAALKGFGVA